MGKIKKVLAAAKIEPRTITASGLWTDLCENIHLHYRNIRFDFSEDEWARMRGAVNGCGLQMEYAAQDKDFREGDPNFLMQFIFNHGVRSDSDYYSDRFLIELQRDNTVHIHYRDLRLHLTVGEFKTISQAFLDAMVNLGSMKKFTYHNAKKKIRRWVDIEEVQPYDEGHRCMAIDEKHRKGIEYVKQLIKDGETIRPILVNTDGQRLDGFKRYMAALELGHDRIECIIDPYAEMGGQHNYSLIDDVPN